MFFSDSCGSNSEASNLHPMRRCFPLLLMINSSLSNT